FSAMPLLRSSFRCWTRSTASGADWPRRDLMRAASSLAAVSSAPSSSCSSRASRLRSRSPRVCRCAASPAPLARARRLQVLRKLGGLLRELHQLRGAAGDHHLELVALGLDLLLALA